jgi:hypothetical protein
VEVYEWSVAGMRERGREKEKEKAVLDSGSMRRFHLVAMASDRTQAVVRDELNMVAPASDPT